MHFWTKNLILSYSKYLTIYLTIADIYIWIINVRFWSLTTYLRESYLVFSLWGVEVRPWAGKPVWCGVFPVTAVTVLGIPICQRIFQHGKQRLISYLHVNWTHMSRGCIVSDTIWCIFLSKSEWIFYWKKKPTKYLSTKLMTISQKKGYFSQIQTSIHIEPCHSTTKW